MSEAQIFEVAEPILKNAIAGARDKNWDLFSKYMPIEDSSNDELKANVEKQWQEGTYLTAFSRKFDFLGVIRKPERILVVFRLTSTLSKEEYLEKLYLEERDGKIVQAGIWTE
ncbi:hypothetical protein AB833_15735 [Chromatiales bacterium (ex Bugula neritina AB1)]|nr:hypothetical protein AB833_15735 [Chromatiales bacterium (ex Bugula neritina AB1)]